MRKQLVPVLMVSVCLITPGSFAASSDQTLKLKARLGGVQEVPVVSTESTGTFEATLEPDGSLSYKLTYEGLEGGNVLFSHIHLGQFGANGSIMTFLCGGGTKPTACPAPGGTVEGTIAAADIQAIGTQQIPTGGFDEFLRALRLGFAYVNVHTASSPGGEIRGQIVRVD